MPAALGKVRPPSLELWPPLAALVLTAVIFGAYELLLSAWSSSEASPAWAAAQLDTSSGRGYDRNAVDAELHEVLVFAAIMLMSAITLTCWNTLWRFDRKNGSAFGKT